MMEFKFKYVKSSVEESGNITGHFIMENLINGQGLTIGNALRRVLLSNMEGMAFTAIKIPLASHEFSIIPGIREDILELLLNLKQIVLKCNNTDLKKSSAKIRIEGPGIVTGNSILFESDISVVNPNQYIATITTKTVIEFDLIIEKGIGYQFSDQNEQKYPNFFDIDAIFMPISKVNYNVNNIYTTYSKTTESLEFEITTDGSISPEKALSQASKKLMTWFSNLTSEEDPKISGVQSLINVTQRKIILIEELELSIRAYNCLKRAGINSVEELMKYSQEEIKDLKNFGKKSASEVFQALKNKFNIILPSLKS